MTQTRNARPVPRDARPVTHAATVGKRVHAAERMVQKWKTSYPPLPRTVREKLADMLLAEGEQ